MAAPEHVARFEKGDKVPDWLLSVEPTNADSEPPVMRFLLAVDAIRVSGRLWMIPDASPGELTDDGIFDLSGGRWCRIIAGSGAVSVVHQWWCLTAPDA